jgi:hypothetical protein
MHNIILVAELHVWNSKFILFYLFCLRLTEALSLHYSGREINALCGQTVAVCFEIDT